MWEHFGEPVVCFVCALLKKFVQLLQMSVIDWICASADVDNLHIWAGWCSCFFSSVGGKIRKKRFQDAHTLHTRIQENQVWKLAFAANWLFFSPAVADFACCCSVVTYLKREKVFSELSKFTQWFGFLNEVLQWRQRWEGGYSRGYLVQLRLFAVSVDSLVRTKCKMVTKSITMKHWTASASTTTKNIQKQPRCTGEPQLAERWRAYRLLTGNSVLEVELVSFQSTQLLTRL